MLAMAISSVNVQSASCQLEEFGIARFTNTILLGSSQKAVIHAREQELRVRPHPASQKLTQALHHLTTLTGSQNHDLGMLLLHVGAIHLDLVANF